MKKEILIELFHNILGNNNSINTIIENHFELLEIESIDYTGVGFYIYFYYKNEPLLLIENYNFLGISQEFYVNNYDIGFQGEFAIEDGKIKYLEIVTYENVQIDFIDSIKFDNLNSLNK